MRSTILFLAVLFSLNSFSQKLDSIEVIAVEKKLESFKPIIKDYLNKIESSSNLNNIKLFGKALEKESNELILEIKSVFKVKEDYIVDYSKDMALSMVLPDLASFYQTSAILKMNDGLNQKTQNYLASLVNINENARQLSKVNKIEKVKKCSNQILIGHQELIAINSESR